MQLKLEKQNDIIIRSFLNDKVITDDTWDVYSSCDNLDSIIVILQNKTSNNKLKLEITKTSRHEDIKKEN